MELFVGDFMQSSIKHVFKVRCIPLKITLTALTGCGSASKDHTWKIAQLTMTVVGDFSFKVHMYQHYIHNNWPSNNVFLCVKYKTGTIS